MSQVYARNRKLSDYEFYNTALAIKLAVNKLMLNEKYVPKRYRFTNAVPCIEIARNIVYNINRADQFYPNSSFNVLQRRKYFSLAIADCEQICIELQTMIDMDLGVKEQLKSQGEEAPNKIEELIDLIETEIALLKGVRKNVRIVGKQSVVDKIRDAEEELLRLRDVQAQTLAESDDL